MERPKRPFLSLKTPTKDEPPPSEDEVVPPKKSLKDKIDFFEKTAVSKGGRDAGKF